MRCERPAKQRRGRRNRQMNSSNMDRSHRWSAYARAFPSCGWTARGWFHISSNPIALHLTGQSSPERGCAGAEGLAIALAGSHPCRRLSRDRSDRLMRCQSSRKSRRNKRSGEKKSSRGTSFKQTSGGGSPPPQTSERLLPLRRFDFDRLDNRSPPVGPRTGCFHRHKSAGDRRTTNFTCGHDTLLSWTGFPQLSR